MISPIPVPPPRRDYDGVYLLGGRFTPGTYTTAGPEFPNKCMWARFVRESDGYLRAVEARTALPNTGTGPNRIATIKAADVAFSTNSCAEWRSGSGVPGLGSLDFGSAGPAAGSTGSGR